MKRIFLLVLAAALPLLCMAQPRQPRPEDMDEEQLVKMQTEDMVRCLNLEDGVKAQFEKVYSDFRREINSVAREMFRPARSQSEEDIEKAILGNFDVSQKILDIRRKYYSKFREFMKPSQIQRMYRNERDAGHHMQEGPSDRRGPRGEDRPGERPEPPRW